MNKMKKTFGVGAFVGAFVGAGIGVVVVGCVGAIACVENAKPTKRFQYVEGFGCVVVATLKF